MKTKLIELSSKTKQPVTMLQYNRPIDKGLVVKLKESMNKYGVLSAVTVYDSGEEYMVVDGQHRWTAASELGLPIFAIVIGWDAMSAIVEMNTIQTNWTMENFVDFFCAHSDPAIRNAYGLLRNKMKTTENLTYSSLAKIYGKPYGGTAFKKGKWRVTDENRGDLFVKYLDEIQEYLPYSKSARFIHAYTDVAFHEEYSHKRLMSKLSKEHGVSIMTTSNPGTYGRMLTKIYNYHQSKNLVMFKSSWI